MADASDTRTSPTLIERMQLTPADSAAWASFCRLYEPKIRGWCTSWGLQRADADDVTQLVLAKLVETIREFRYDPGQQFRSWLRTVTRHVWLDLRDRLGTRGVGGDAGQLGLDALEARVDLEQRLAEAYDAEYLELAMARVRGRVTPRTWEAFRLTALEGRSGAEAAGILGMAVAHVFVSKHRVLAMVRDEVRRCDDGSTGPRA